jgi:hypothetical protein
MDRRGRPPRAALVCMACEPGSLRALRGGPARADRASRQRSALVPARGAAGAALILNTAQFGNAGRYAWPVRMAGTLAGTVPVMPT